MTLRHTGKVKSTVTGGLNVRVSPSLSAAKLDTKLYANTPIEGVGDFVQADGNIWINITSPLQGWASTSYITIISSVDVPDVPPTAPEFPLEFWVSMTENGEKRRYILDPLPI